MNKKITTALFDLDGVLIDSARLVEGAFDHTFAAFNIATQYDPVADGGLTIRERYGRVVTEADLPKFMQTHADFQKNNLHLVTAFDDAVSTLQILRGKGIYIGVITNRSINARHIIEHCALAPLIDFVVSVEDVTNPKPHPEGILKAMGHFGSKSSETIMVGDMPVDIQAGKAAGVTTVAIDTSECLEALVKSRPDHVVKTLAEIVHLLF
jgi:pyrophosphatase PpaX